MLEEKSDTILDSDSSLEVTSKNRLPRDPEVTYGIRKRLFRTKSLKLSHLAVDRALEIMRLDENDPALELAEKTRISKRKDRIMMVVIKRQVEAEETNELLKKAMNQPVIIIRADNVGHIQVNKISG